MGTITPVSPTSTAPLPDPTKPFAEQDPVTLLAMCIFGEVRGDVWSAQLGVGNVVKNRLAQHWMGAKTWSDVILKPWQFDAFQPSDPNSKKLLTPLQYEEPVVWQQCYAAAYRVFHNVVADNTKGAVFYYSLPIKSPPHDWGNVQQTVVYGKTAFFKLV